MSRIKDPKAQQAAINALHNDSETRDVDSISIRSRHTLHAFSGAGEADDEEDPWSAIPRPINNSSSSPSDIPTLTAAQRKQLLLRALLQLLALFFVCLIGLGGTLWLALPVISPEDKPFFKLPKSFEDLQNLNSVLQHYKSSHFTQVLLCWVVVYIFLQAFSIPGSMYMSILAGALFGVSLALPLVYASVATGASVCYLISRELGVVLVVALPSWKMRVDDWKEKLAEHQGGNLLSYLVVIRMMPLPPHNIVNILSPHLGIPLPLFWISTFFGIFAVSVIHVTIEEKLDQMTSADDFHLFSLRNVLLLGGVAAAVMVPVFIRRFSKVKALEGAEDGNGGRGEVFLGDEDEGVDEDAQRLPDSFRRNLVGVRASGYEDEESDEDELPRRNLDTNNILSSADNFEPYGGAEESFPSWRQAPGLDDDDDEGLEGRGRGGVFSDRTTINGVASGNSGSGGDGGATGKLKAWFGGGTGIKL